MNKEVIFSQEVRSKLLKGMKIVADAVTSTMGVGGRTVLFRDERGRLRATKDGVTVAKYIYDLVDKVENDGAELLKYAASRTAQDAGDGPQPLYSKILTPTGFVKMQDIKVGDVICGTGGTFQNVIGVFPKGNKKIYKLHFSGNRTVECCEDHLWSVRDKSNDNACILPTYLLIKYGITNYSVPLADITCDDKYADILDYQDTGIFTEMQCIKVSNSDNLYITDDYIVTHNTTTSTLLAYTIADLVFSELERNKLNLVEVKKGIDKATQVVVSKLKTISQPIKDENEMRKVATLSANGDEQIGELIIKALQYVGKEGIVSIEESDSADTKLSKVEGLQFNRGYTGTSPFFVNDQSTGTCILKNPYVFVHEGSINTIKHLIPMLSYVKNNNKGLLIIADDYADEVKSILLHNKANGGFNVCAVKAPEFAEWRRSFYDDVATITSGKVFSLAQSSSFTEDFSDASDLEYLGECRKVQVKHDTTIIIDGKVDKKRFKTTVDALRKRIKGENVEQRREKLTERLAKLAGGVAMLQVGGYNDVERREKKDRFDDALYATKSAMQEGIIPGGGTVLYRIADDNDLFASIEGKNKYQQIGINILRVAIRSPFYKILSNAGIDEDNGLKDIELEIVKNDNVVYNPLLEEYVDAYESGIIDPVKVTRLALENAVGIAGTILLTEADIVEIPSKQPIIVQNKIEEE